MGVLQDLKDNILGTEKQNKEAQANLDKQASQGSGLAKALGGNPQPAPQPPKKMSKGGTASARADGIAQRGKTKGRFV